MQARPAWNSRKGDVVRFARMQAAVALANQRSKARRTQVRPAERVAEPVERPQQGPEEPLEGEPQQEPQDEDQLEEGPQEILEEGPGGRAVFPLVFPIEDQPIPREEVKEDQDWTDCGFVIEATMMVVFGMCAMACGEPFVINSLSILAWMLSLVMAQFGCTAVFVSHSAATFLLCVLLSYIVSRHHTKTLEEDRLRKIPMATRQAKLVTLHSIQRPDATPMLAMSALLAYRRRRDLPLLHAKILVGPIHAILFNGTLVYIVHIAADKTTKWRITATVDEVRKLRDCMQREVEDGDALLAFAINSVTGMQTFLSAITTSALWSSAPSLRKFCQMY